MADTTIFEHPLNEKCRTWLRLSHLFEQFDFHRQHVDEWHARAAVAALLDIANVLSRADIKSELLKELERYRQSLSRMANSPGVDTERLNAILEDLSDSCQGVRNVNGQLAQALRNNDFLASIVQRSSIPGGAFDFDLPQFHYWLRTAEQTRDAHLAEWRNEVVAVHAAVDLLLKLIRSSAVPSTESAPSGFYQQSLPGNVAAQLVRVGIPSSAGMYAEISGGKHRFSVRFLDCADWQHPLQVDQSVDFSLSICMI
ncbi:MAG: cell division protein ZapD [Gammaproteobacteria bacterium]|nr:cell division protein ZapD [Gammaproteobacteria bacterium]MCB1926149.1 cell division protein ZapD [Gammaproteobacteria bacterium]